MLTVVGKGVKFVNIKGIIFDKDGTLADSRQFLRELAQKRARLIDCQIPGTGDPLLMAFGLQNQELNPAGLMAVGSRLENEIAAAAYIAETGKSWFEAKAIAVQAFLEADKYLPALEAISPPYDDTKEVLAKLSQAGLKLGILSADSTLGVQEFVTKYQLSNYIELSMGVDSELTKPDPELYLKACQSLNLPPSATLMVGDAQGDLEMAKKAGAGGAIAIYRHQQQNIKNLSQADIVINSLRDLEILT
ncbi:HAD family hydrolase [Gloeocapsa sp. PCC 73106]|uniref:HAD family hydrolase n=1 Tax=Gloeocapsa sp. PCC 73106 TaxID=102232 RepID=UPI0002ABCF0F|nr:HAD family hydrolase [Gloeocapsa sp. PCC 73106]ELR97677.1 haloacid dehalogenase superfamily enzyme, subfamily IA [Gloeocapsa sp. PCC 73106]